jgi:polyferredoxin
MENLLNIVLVGIGATLVMDLGSLLRRRVFGTPLPNYLLVGRWIAHMGRGQFRHASMAAAAPIPGEQAIGWTAHYLIGIAFAGLLPAVGGSDWFAAPSPIPALIVGAGTLLAPFLLMQPAMGAGVAASRAPRPGAARLQSLVNHLVFGFGLYAAALAVCATR